MLQKQIKQYIPYLDTDRDFEDQNSEQMRDLVQKVRMLNTYIYERVITDVRSDFGRSPGFQALRESVAYSSHFETRLRQS